MRVELTEVVWFEGHVLTFTQLSDLSGLPPLVLQELIDAGGIAPLEHGGAQQSGRTQQHSGAEHDAGTQLHYGARALAAARHARRLREDFELETSALLLVLGLVERVGELEARLQELQAKLPRHHRRG